MGKDSPGRFATPTLDCDLVMKGGITSGVVYPRTILKLAERYRLKSIGGTSAGAIAAAFAAAAEYARLAGDPKGFERLEKRCETLPPMIEKLFQPAPGLRDLFDALKSAGGKGGLLGKAGGILAAEPISASAGAVVGGVLAFLVAGPFGAVLGALLGGIGAPVGRLLSKLGKPLIRNDFGICKGLRTPGSKHIALTEWLHESLQYIAFGEAPHAPLTFGDLKTVSGDGRGVKLRMVTTNLSMRRPHFLPYFQVKVGYKLDEWTSLFPSEVMGHLKGLPPKFLEGDPDIFAVPEPDQLPVIVATRMSLSFPLLLSAVPVWIPDFAGAELSHQVGLPQKVQIVRALLSDGGVSSNFPIHFFDQTVPMRPTFALSLDPLPESLAQASKRVFLPSTAEQGSALPLWPVVDVGSFAMSLLNAAKDWQDNLQSSLPGYRERIARVALLDAEGGLNLSTPETVTRRLMAYGAEAGDLFANAFDFPDHQWRRTMASYHAIAGLSDDIERTWPKVGPAISAYTMKATSYSATHAWAATGLSQGYGAWVTAAQALQARSQTVIDRFPSPYIRLRASLDI